MTALPVLMQHQSSNATYKQLCSASRSGVDPRGLAEVLANTCRVYFTDNFNLIQTRGCRLDFLPYRHGPHERSISTQSDPQSADIHTCRVYCTDCRSLRPVAKSSTSVRHCCLAVRADCKCMGRMGCMGCMGRMERMECIGCRGRVFTQ